MPSSLLPDFVRCVDTMKESRDTETWGILDSEMAHTCTLLADLGVTHITVDTNWDYPTYYGRWVAAVRAVGKKVWHRGEPNQWNNINGATGLMTPTAYNEALETFLLAHPTFFAAGDIFDSGPEPENPPYWDNTYGAGWNWPAPSVGTDAFNAFIVNGTTIARTAFLSMGIDDVTVVRSTNSWWADTVEALYQSTTDDLGFVTMDSYPGSPDTDPATVAAAALVEWRGIHAKRNAPILIGEFGYSNTAQRTEAEQAAALAAYLAELQKLPYIRGLNYWAGMGYGGGGTYTRLFDGTNGAWTRRTAATTLETFFDGTTIAEGTAMPYTFTRQANTETIAPGDVNELQIAVETLSTFVSDVTAVKTTTYTATLNDDVVQADAAGGTFTVTLPTAVGIKGKRFTVKKTTATNTVNIGTTSSQTIDGAAPPVALTTTKSFRTLASDGANWVLVATG